MVPDGKRVTVTLDAGTIERGKSLGDGNLSRGVVKALQVGSGLESEANEVASAAAPVAPEATLD